MKIIDKLYKLLLIIPAFVSGLSSCQAGLTYEEAPESVYTEVGVSQFNVQARELFTDKIWAINYGNGGQWVDNYISTVMIGGNSKKISWTNNTGKDFTLTDGTVVKEGEEIELNGSIVVEDNSDAPDGKLYVMNTYVLPKAIYSTPNKGFLFDGSKFTGDFKLIDPVDNRSQQIELPIRNNELIVEFMLVDAAACTVQPLDNAPTLGKPGDFTSPRRYMVINNKSYRPEGVKESRRMYEVRITVLP